MRGKEPKKNFLALPGGFCDPDETAEEAVEETEVEARESHMTTLTPVQPDASVLAKSTGSVITDGHAYYRFDDIDGSYLTWQQAKEFCENAGGHLATMTSITEYYAIRTLISDGSCYEYWLGATDNEFEGSWKWVTGEPLSWKNWDSGWKWMILAQDTLHLICFGIFRQT